MAALGEIKNTFLRFMKIPENIGAYSIAPHGFCHLYPVAPIFGRDPGRMQLTADNLKGLVIQEKLCRSKGKGVCFFFLLGIQRDC